jgi:aminoglycoside/choline kinase family phosphotransferase
LLHRDLQSSNVLLPRGRPAFIDFQGLRRGPAVYDVASLLCDPYVSLPEELIERLLAWYAAQAPRALGPIVDVFWHGAAQRLVQALGAFGRLAASRDTRRFEEHIPAGLRMLRRATKRLDFLPSLDTILQELLVNEATE